MNCPSCGRPVPEGSPKCVMCGAPRGGGKAAKGAPPPEHQEIDLLPEQAPSAASTAPYDPPPGVLGTPRPPGPGGAPPPRRNLATRGAASHKGGSGKGLWFGVLVGIGLAVFLGLKFCGGGPATKITGRAKFEAALTLYTNSPRIENIEVTGSAEYRFEVNAIDGDVLIGVVRRAPRDPATPAALKRLPEKLLLLQKGETRELTGKWESGQYSWICLNEGKKPVKVKIKFTAQ